MIRIRALGCLLALVATTACGSTVQQSGQGAAVLANGGAVADGLGLPQGTAGPGAPGAPGVAGDDSTGSAGSGAAGAVVDGGAGAAGGSGSVGRPGSGGQPVPAAPGGAAAPDASGAAAVPASGPGWDAKYVYVGVVTQKDSQQVFASFGADYVDPGDTERQAEAAAQAVNAAGGVLGRQLKVVFYDIAILETNQNPSGVGEEVCTYFTQDRRVMAVWNVSTQLDQAPTFRGCLAKAGLPLFSAAARAVDDKLFASLAPYYYHSLMVSWTRLAPVLVGRLQAQDYFAKWDMNLGREGSAPVVVGLLVQDVPEGARTAAALQRALASAGVGAVEVFAYARPEDGQSASVQSFKGRNVTHVIVADVELLAFQMSAASQNYKPRYGLTTYNAPYANLEQGGLSPPGANNGAVGVGWAPAMDVSGANDPGPTPGWPRCQRAMALQQQSFSGKRLAQALAATLCDTLFLIKAGAEAGGGLTAPTIRSGVQNVGSRFPVAIGFGPALTSNAPFAPGQVRDLVWDASCGCVKYGRGGASLVS